MRILITGVGGFAGSHLADHCLARSETEVFGLVRSASRAGNAPRTSGRFRLIEADVRNAGAVGRAIEESKPEIVFHLAGQAFVPASFDDPAGTLLDNAVGQLNVIRAILRHVPTARLLVVGSCLEYGLVRPDENPVDEKVMLRPADPYAVSKVTQDLMGYQYFASNDLQAIRVRPFNHTGPRQRDDFVASRFAKQIAEIEANQRIPELQVGNLSAVRDFTDVRDMARAYFLAATRGVPGEVYNIGSGAGRRVDEVLRTLAAFSQVYFTIREDPTRLRPPDVPSLVCNSAKFRAQTGWEPLIPFERTMNDLLNHWRSEISGVQIENLALGVGENPLSEVITAQPSPTDVGMVRQGVA